MLDHVIFDAYRLVPAWQSMAVCRSSNPSTGQLPFAARATWPMVSRQPK